MHDARTRVLLLHSTLHIGGAEEVGANLCRRIDRQKFEVEVACLKEMGVVAEKMVREGTAVHSLSNGNSNKPDYLTSWKLRRLLKNYRPQIIHSHDVHSLIDGAICRRTTWGVRHVHTFHFGNYPNRERPQQKLERLGWRIPDALVSVSRQQKEGLKRLYGIDDKRIEVLWNGVDVLPAATPIPAIDECRHRGRLVIGCVNTLIEQKGMPDLIKVALELKSRDLPDFEFLVVGGGPLLEALRRETEEKGLSDTVRFLDWMPDAAPSVLPFVDIFFQPSLWEAMSIVLLEAMAFSRPIVATAVGETPRTIEDRVSGMLVGVGDTGAMADRLAELLVDEDSRKNMGERAKERYQREFTARRMAERYETLYSQLVDGKLHQAVAKPL